MSVSDSKVTPLPGVLQITGQASYEKELRDYFFILMAWDWEVAAGDAMKHRYDNVDEIYVLSTASPYFDNVTVSRLGSGKIQYWYQFYLPLIPSQVSLNGKLEMVAIMNPKREILRMRKLSV